MPTLQASREQPAPATERAVPSGGQRADIQALRALAVSLVVIYHFWPHRLTGGYVGVDVFFVISGFLITTHLIQNPPARLGDLASFWGRRIRRLLPAALLVLVASLVATWLVAPSTLWHDTTVQAIASAFYAQNWALAAQAVDYMAADSVPTAVQHYWSLSIEEQFYLCWPVLIMLSGIFVRRRGGSLLSGAACCIVIVTLISFASSALAPSTDAAAYFHSWTRFWELGAGGLAAFVAIWLPAAEGGRTLRTLLAWAGLAGIVFSAWTYDETTVFPGSAAALPVLATALVILAAPVPGAGSPLPLMGLRPVQWLGGVSYSVYLWHWPVIVLLPFALGHPPSWPVKAGALAVVFLLAWGTKITVEDPLRGSRPLGMPLRRSFVFALSGALVVSAVGAGLEWRTRLASEAPTVAAGRPCFGAQALIDRGCDSVHGESLVTPPAFAATDMSPAAERGCVVGGGYTDRASCTFGAASGKQARVALIGNSHADMWLPALDEVAERRGWRVTTYLIENCYTVARKIDFEDKRTGNCASWNRWAIGEVSKGDFDLVITGNRSLQPLVGVSEADKGEVLTRAYEKVLRQWMDGGKRVLVLQDVPRAGFDDDPTDPQCVEANASDLAACDAPISQRDVPVEQADAARQINDERVKVFDPTPYVCPDGICRAVVGGVIVHYDLHHLSGTFVRSLAPQLGVAVEQAMEGSN
ncbi:acyltransferase family protein [Nocardioides panzhihuensis]|uniref:Peptidoglycan/LPS O-acetylase OafA/YrhL n=1 Tax=Nocardioides panzhihuensis TaxID=860243 RepID=A0A7Z0IR38_9ACTN|nr:acyltransferase family protein [Nocardioides panzhihuensis]NYI76312.1 peptidoglycan/LPS O-acetylase OafA/YrhL [Nocardioides panzhihuensis]